LDPDSDRIRIQQEDLQADADLAKYLDTDSVSVNPDPVSVNLDPNHCKAPPPPPPGHHVSNFSSGKLFLQNINYKSVFAVKVTQLSSQYPLE
jgi:hypothetical protein